MTPKYMLRNKKDFMTADVTGFFFVCLFCFVTYFYLFLYISVSYSVRNDDLRQVCNDLVKQCTQMNFPY